MPYRWRAPLHRTDIQYYYTIYKQYPGKILLFHTPQYCDANILSKPWLDA